VLSRKAARRDADAPDKERTLEEPATQSGHFGQSPHRDAVPAAKRCTGGVRKRTRLRSLVSAPAALVWSVEHHRSCRTQARVKLDRSTPA
jgi:hypothetical protein